MSMYIVVLIHGIYHDVEYQADKDKGGKTMYNKSKAAQFEPAF